MNRFEWIFLAAGVLMYALGAAAGGAAARHGERRRLAQARLAGLLGALYHLAVLASLGIRTGHFPVTGAPEAFLALAAMSVLVALGFDALRRLSVLLIGTLPLAFVTALLAMALLLAPGADAAPGKGASSVWTALHIFTALGAYLAFGFAFVAGILYLVAQQQLKDHRLSSTLGLMPPLQSIARLNLRSTAVGAALLAASILVGYIEARSVYDRQFDRLDPKIILSTLTFAVYLAVLALHRRPDFRGRRAAFASLAGFLLVMVNFWASVFWSGFHNFR